MINPTWSETFGFGHAPSTDCLIAVSPSQTTPLSGTKTGTSPPSHAIPPWESGSRDPDAPRKFSLHPPLSSVKLKAYQLTADAVGIGGLEGTVTKSRARTRSGRNTAYLSGLSSFRILALGFSPVRRCLVCRGWAQGFEACFAGDSGSLGVDPGDTDL